VLLFSLPALAKILLTFGLVLLLSRKLPLYVCLFVGSVVIGLWMGMGAVPILGGIWSESIAGRTLWLALVIVLILILSGLLQTSGQLDRMVASFQAVSPDPRFTLAAMPALIGLLPMPGGALFSAPMVEAAVASEDAEPELKVAVNYWFRHIWEFWWPLYPGIILAISLFGLESWKLMVAQVPLTIGSLIGGVLFILAHAPKGRAPEQTFSGSALRNFAREAMPITVVILVFGGLQAVVEIVRYFSGIALPSPKYSGLALGILVAIGLVIKRNSLDKDQVRKAVLNPGILSMVMIVFAIMSFKGLLVESKAIEHVRWELAAYGIPPILVIALLPFIAGLVTGIAIGFVGASFPLVVALIPVGQSPFPFAVLAFGFGYMGMMLSPVHLCLLVTREYFAADLMSGYTYLWKPILFGLVWTTLLFAVYRIALG